MNRETSSPAAKPAAQDYSQSSPETIRSDIEKTRAHLDETLSRLGHKIRPGFGDKRKAIAVAALTILAGVGLALLKARLGRGRKHAGKSRAGWKRASAYENILVLRALIAAARKGKPAVFVVDPKRL